jgi:hypothetical protein
MKKHINGGKQKSGNEKLKFHCIFHFWCEKFSVTEMWQTSDVTNTSNTRLHSSILQHHYPSYARGSLGEVETCVKKKGKILHNAVNIKCRHFWTVKMWRD